MRARSQCQFMFRVSLPEFSLESGVVPADGAQSGGLSIAMSDVKVRLFGDTAIVTAKGVQKTGEKRALRFTVVFVKRNGVWQMVAGHLSAVPE